MRRSAAMLAAVLLFVGCTTEGTVVETVGRGSSPLPPPSTTATPITLAAATATTVVAVETTTPPTTATPTTTSPPTTTITTLPPVAGLEGGLFCRDLVAMGYDYPTAVTYWVREGSPDRMDADRNGIPCETVFPESDVLAFWGSPLPTTTVVSIVYRPLDPELFPVPLPGSDDAAGSGCASGTDWLPDGVWFGYVTGRADDHLDFDLACIWTGEAAVREAAEDGIENPLSFYIRNHSAKIRKPAMAGDATVYHLGISPWYTSLSYDEWRAGACHGFETGSCPVWLYVNGGKVTAIVEQFFA
ncbi:MAG: hypothetical protein U9N84_05445 [Actinomycetota bacterium]|nr:hypothetical protein [Actinomycetota bacterium]